MGQKVHPIGFRLGITRTWDSRWYSKRDYAKLLHEDLKLREYIKAKLFGAGIARIEIAHQARLKGGLIRASHFAGDVLKRQPIQISLSCIRHVVTY